MPGPGRKGRPNKRSQALARHLREDYDLDAVHEMAHHAVYLSKLAKRQQVKHDEGEISRGEVTEATQEAIGALDKVAVYTTPKLKAVEVELTGDLDIVSEHRGLSEISERVAELIEIRADRDSQSGVQD